MKWLFSPCTNGSNSEVMVGGSGRIHSSIFIGDDEGALGPTDVYSTLPPPIVFTGQKLNGSLHITHYGVEEGIFDAVHFILKGI